jgi:hypothetical protein
MRVEFSQQILEKYSNIKFHENQSTGSRDRPKDRQTAMIDNFQNFEIPPMKNPSFGMTRTQGSHHNPASLKQKHYRTCSDLHKR